MIIMANTLGAYLVRELSQRGLSQRQAATAWDIPLSTMNGIVNDESTPSLPTLRKLADGLKVSVVKLIELAGFGDSGTPDPAAMLTDADRAFINSLSPEELRELLDFVRAQRQRYEQGG